MKHFTRLFYLVRFPNTKNLGSSVRYSTIFKLSPEKKGRIKISNRAPSLFNEKLGLFKKGLEAEIIAINDFISSEITEKNRTPKNQAFYNVRVKKTLYDTLYGKVIELCDSKLIGLNPSNFSNAKAFTLKQNDKQFLSYLMDYNPNNGTMLFKFFSSPEEWKEIKENSIFDILPSAKSTLCNVLDFLIAGQFTKMPGWKTLELIYKGSKSPVAYSDRSVQFDGEFNKTQQNAIKAALNQNRRILCIGGPPGTGKTHVIAEIIKQLLKQGKKILVVVPRPNVITNIYKRIDLKKYKHCSMVGDESSSINVKTKNHKDFESLKYLAEFICEIKKEDGETEYIQDYSQLVENYRIGINRDFIKESQLIFTSAGRNVMNLIEGAKFIPDVVLLEEGSQILECVSLRFLLSGRRSIVVGDHNQLVTTLNSKSAEKDFKLNVSIIEYLWNNLSTVDKIMLDTQYRMNKKIMEWSSKTFYDNAMIAHDSVENITLSDISSIKNDSEFNSPLLVFDSKNCSDFREIMIQKSYANIREVNVCAKYIKFLLKKGLKESDIGIITAYNAQKMKIVEHLKGHNIKVSTVDGFQGQEKEVIIFCYVRNNKNKNVGFLNEKRRMNVALTRAKRQFAFIGNTDMLSTDESFEELKNTLLNNGVSIDAGQYLLKRYKVE